MGCLQPFTDTRVLKASRMPTLNAFVRASVSFDYMYPSETIFISPAFDAVYITNMVFRYFTRSLVPGNKSPKRTSIGKLNLVSVAI
jgi:hypothetical protein